MNLYSYVQGNPLKYVDPSGNSPTAAYLTYEAVKWGGLAIISYYAAKATKDTAEILKNHDFSEGDSESDGDSGNEEDGNNTDNDLSKDAKSDKKSRNKPRETGVPSSSRIDLNNNGEIKKYTTYDENGKIKKEVRLTGKDHGDIPRPNVKEPYYNTNPKTGKKFHNGYKVRPTRKDEIPSNKTTNE